MRRSTIAFLGSVVVSSLLSGYSISVAQNHGPDEGALGSTWRQAIRAGINGGVNTQSGTTYTMVSSDCGKTLVFTSNSAVTATIPAAIVPSLGTSCVIGVIQSGTAKVSVNGSAVTAATLISGHSYTGTSGTAGSEIGLTLTTVGTATNAYLTGDGS